MASKKKTKTESKKSADLTKELPYVIARCGAAGVHAGYLKSEKGGRVTLLKARRIWSWEGAASLSEIAVYGCAEPSRAACRFAARLEQLALLTSDVCELIYTQPEGQKMIEGQPEWRAGK